MKVLLIQPAMGHLKGKKLKRPWTLEPLAIATLAGLTPPDVQLEFYDDRIEEIQYDPSVDLVGISVETSTALRSYEIAKKFRQLNIPVVMGGVHPTLMPDEVSNHADAIVMGQAEQVWETILEDAAKKKLKKKYQKQNPSLDKIKIDRAIFEGKKYLPVQLIEFGRGCPYRCEFCDIPVYYDGRYDIRPIDHIVSEIKQSNRQFFLIVDDNLGVNPKRLEEFCHAIKPLNISWVSQTSIHLAKNKRLLELVSQSGCKGFLIGFESISPENLSQMNKTFNLTFSFEEALKRFNDHNLRILASFIVGYDHDTPESIEQLVNFAIKNKVFLANFNPLIPVPNTQLYNRLKQENRLVNDKWWLDYNYTYSDYVYTPKQLTAQQMADECIRAKEKFYQVNSIVRRAMGSKTNMRNLKSFMMYLFFNFMSRKEIKLKIHSSLGLKKSMNVVNQHLSGEMRLQES